MKTTITVEIGIGGERLHHCLIERLSVIGTLQNDVAVGKYTIDVTIGLRVAGNQVAFGVTTYITGRKPVLLGMHQKRIVLGGPKIQHRR